MSHFDRLEIQDPKSRRATLQEALPLQIEHAKRKSPAYARLLAHIDPQTIDSREALRQLPILRRSDIAKLQRQNPPFGGLAVMVKGDVARLYQAPGVLYSFEVRRSDFWRMARALFAAGFRKNDLIHNGFSYHFSPRGFMIESGAQELGCCLFPAGDAPFERQVAAIADLKPSGFAGTPSQLKGLMQKADERHIDISSLEKALLTGEPLSTRFREDCHNRGIHVYQCYTTADLGLVAYESSARDGLIVDEGVLVETVRPGTDEPCDEGEEGEIVVTTFNPDYPLIRLGTGDISAILPGASACGRTNLRLKGWLGRVDQAVPVYGQLVYPSHVQQVLQRHSAIQRGCLVLHPTEKEGTAVLQCEVEQGDAELAQAIARSFWEVSSLRITVALVPLGTLAPPDRLIDDRR